MGDVLVQAEHRVRVLSSRGAANGYCQTCGWQGPLRWTGQQASVDAALHADTAARGEAEGE